MNIINKEDAYPHKYSAVARRRYVADLMTAMIVLEFSAKYLHKICRKLFDHAQWRFNSRSKDPHCDEYLQASRVRHLLR